MTMDAIEAKARIYAAARERLAETVAALNDAIAALKREHLPTIKRQMRQVFETENALRAIVEQHPDLFERPRTVVLHGVKVGFAKGKGRIEFDNADQVVALIERRMADQAEVLIATTKVPVLKAMQQLTVQQLRSIGCRVIEAGDQVVVRACDSDIDKLVKQLLKALQDQAAAEEEAA